MPAGLEVYSPLGVLKLSIGDRVLRFLGDPIILSGGGSGSVVNDGLLTGTPFWVSRTLYNDGATYWPGDSLFRPTVGVSGNTLYYSSVITTGTKIIQYGVY